MKKSWELINANLRQKEKNRLPPILFQPFFAHNTFMAFIGAGEGKLGRRRMKFERRPAAWGHSVKDGDAQMEERNERTGNKQLGGLLGFSFGAGGANLIKKEERQTPHRNSKYSSIQSKLC
jgi:hypothetical protein